MPPHEQQRQEQEQQEQEQEQEQQEQTSNHAPVGKVLHIPAGQGPTVWLNGDVYTVKADKDHTAGGLALLEVTVPPGGGPPPHIHTREDESFYVLDGQLEIRAAGHTYDVKAGDFVHIPRGTVHYFRNTGLHAVKQLIIFTPAGLEEFFLEAGIEAQPGVSVPPFDEANNLRAHRIAAALGAPQVPEEPA